MAHNYRYYMIIFSTIYALQITAVCFVYACSTYCHFCVFNLLKQNLKLIIQQLKGFLFFQVLFGLYIHPISQKKLRATFIFMIIAANVDQFS